VWVVVVRKLPAWLGVGGLVLMVFVVVVGLRFLRDGGRFVPDDGGARRNVTGSTAVHIEPSVISRGSPAASSIPDKTDPRSESTSAAPRADRPTNGAGGVPQDESSRPGGPSVLEGEGSDPNAVIGRAFPVSTSVEAMCKKISSKGEDACADTHQVLAEFAQQPRDPTWASSMEGRLRDLVMSEPGYTIRTLECRTSLCVAEVASINGMFNFITPVGSDPALHRDLMPGVGETGYEIDPSSMARITVTLMPFERRR